MKTHALYLNGEWLVSETTLPVTNPATEEIIARVSVVERDAAARALEGAGRAFPDWRRTTGRERGDFLLRIAAELEKRAAEVARLMTIENGKPITQSEAEVAMSVDHLRWFAEEGRRGYGRVIPHQVQGKRNLVIKSPIGVVAAISPWNFPLVLSARKVAPALAAGCPIVLKPSSHTPLCNLAFAECVAAADLPKGVFHLVLGKAADIAAEFLENPACRKISFTGSTAVGKQLIAGAAPQVKPLSLELGGLGPALVFDDADMETAVDGVLMAKFRNTGQSCIAANRIYAQRGIHDAFVERFVAKTRALKVGNGLDRETQIGPLIDEEAVAKAARHVEDAVAGGARLLCGGRRVEGKGYFFEPTVLSDVPADALCMNEETFAPVAAIVPFDTEEEAVALANGSPFGLSAYLFTTELSRAFRLMETIEAGIIGINDGVPTTSQAPFGGVKQSGWGRELGSEGLESFLDTKHVSLGVS